MAIIFSNSNEYASLKGNYYKSARELFEQEIHPQIKNKIIREVEVKQDEQDALKLEYYFQEIKNYIQKHESKLSGVFIDEIINNTPKDLQKAFDYSMFGRYQSQASGAAFERDLTNIVYNVITKVSGIEPDENLINIGGKTASPDILFSGADLQKFFNKKILPTVMKYSVEEITKNINDQPMYKLQGKQGKIDIMVPSSTEILQYEGSQELLEFYNLLLGSSFSAKNYLSTDGSAYVKIGNTSSLRLYASTLAYLNPEFNNEEIKKIYFAARNSRNAADHKKHMRFIYELMGPGLKYQGEDLGLVKFLIVNERNGSGIKVLSTKSLVYNALKDTMKGTGTHLSIVFTNDSGLKFDR